MRNLGSLYHDFVIRLITMRSFAFYVGFLRLPSVVFRGTSCKVDSIFGIAYAL